MRIIAYLNTKGGVGKTTSSIMTAEAARRAGFSSAVLDADPQGSASEWAERAAENGTALKFVVEDANRARLSRKAAKSTVDYLFIDTGPADPAMIQAAADIADLVVIPTRTTPGDLDRAITTHQALGGAAALLLWDINPRHQLYRQARELLTAQGIVAFNAEIPSREDVNKLWFTGLDVHSLYGYEDVFDELYTALTATPVGGQS